MEEQGGERLVDRMARDVVRMQGPPASVAQEGEDWKEPPGGPASGQLGQPIQNGPQPQQASNQPVAPPPGPQIPELLGINVKEGVLFTSIGNFPIQAKERNRIARICLRVIKGQLALTYKVLERGAAIRQRAVRSDKGRVKPKRRHRKTAAPGLAS